MRSASNCLYPVMPILPLDGFTARFGLVTVFVQQFLQKFTAPLDDAQNEIVAVGVSRRQMPSVHKAMDVAFGVAPCFEQCIMGCAFVDVFSDELPPLHLTPTDRVVRKFWCVDQGVEIGMRIRCVQSELSQQLRLCRRLSCAHLIACCCLAYWQACPLFITVRQSG